MVRTRPLPCARGLLAVMNCLSRGKVQLCRPMAKAAGRGEQKNLQASMCPIHKLPGDGWHHTSSPNNSDAFSFATPTKLVGAPLVRPRHFAVESSSKHPLRSRRRTALTELREPASGTKTQGRLQRPFKTLYIMYPLWYSAAEINLRHPVSEI